MRAALVALAALVAVDRLLAWLARPYGWDVLDLKEVHVVPIRDVIDHETEGLDCICGPEVVFHERPLVTHASLDGRERYEG